MLPQIIHQYWDGILPGDYQVFSKQLRDLNPQFQYTLWNKDKVIASAEDHPLTPLLKLVKEPKGASDIARIILLDIFGGIYLDSDIEPNRSIPLWLLQHDCFACYENERTTGQTLANGAVGGVCTSPFIRKLVEEVSQFKLANARLITATDAWRIVGPRLWTKIFFDLNCRHIIVYPSWYFIPNHYNDTPDIEKTTGYIGTHVWGDYKSWPHIVHYTHGFRVEMIDKFKAIEVMKR